MRCVCGIHHRCNTCSIFAKEVFFLLLPDRLLQGQLRHLVHSAEQDSPRTGPWSSPFPMSTGRYKEVKSLAYISVFSDVLNYQWAGITE